MTTEAIRLNVRVEIDPTLGQGEARVSSDGLRGETVVAIGDNCWVNLLSAFNMQVVEDYTTAIMKDRS